MKTFVAAIACLLAGMLITAQAAEKSAIQLNIAAGDISSQIDVIMEKIQQPQYVEMSKSDRAELTGSLTEIESGTLDAAAAASAQSEANKILSQAFADSRLVCTYYQVLGTRQRQKACMTVADKKAANVKTQRDIKQNTIPSLNQSAPRDSNL